MEVKLDVSTARLLYFRKYNIIHECITLRCVLRFNIMSSVNRFYLPNSVFGPRERFPFLAGSARFVIFEPGTGYTVIIGRGPFEQDRRWFFFFIFFFFSPFVKPVPRPDKITFFYETGRNWSELGARRRLRRVCAHFSFQTRFEVNFSQATFIRVPIPRDRRRPKTSFVKTNDVVRTARILTRYIYIFLYVGRLNFYYNAHSVSNRCVPYIIIASCVWFLRSNRNVQNRYRYDLNSRRTEECVVLHIMIRVVFFFSPRTISSRRFGHIVDSIWQRIVKQLVHSGGHFS